MRLTAALGIGGLALLACGRAAPPPPVVSAETERVRIYQTSKSGDALADKGALLLASTPAGDAPTLSVDLAAERQTIVGFGGAFTESSAYVLDTLEPAARQRVIDAYFGAEGARYSLTRTHIGSCDFGPKGRYSYASKADLSDFSVAEDEPDLIPLIKDAQRSPGASFEIIASPWSAPPFMKEGETRGDGYFGGKLAAAHYPTFASYIARYVDAYAQRGIEIWAVTPENEPIGNGSQWESMEFTPAEMASFIKSDLGPKMAERGVKILAYDQNRDHAEEWVAAILGDPETHKYVHGTALHWYSSTYEVYPQVLERIHAAHPDKVMLNSEATSDVVWDDAAEWEPPPKPGEQLNHQPKTIHYWKNWRWWWEVRTTDWGHRWAKDKRLHPRHSSANRYIRDIIGGLNHWFVGWVDWNLVLDKRGGPNHVGNFCAAPVMVDTEAREVFYTPLYYVMSHFSRFIRPGAVVLKTRAPEGLIATAARNPDGSTAVVVANIAPHPSRYDAVRDRTYVLELGGLRALGEIEAHAIQTLIVRPPG